MLQLELLQNCLETTVYYEKEILPTGGNSVHIVASSAIVYAYDLGMLEDKYYATVRLLEGSRYTSKEFVAASLGEAAETAIEWIRKNSNK